MTRRAGKYSAGEDDDMIAVLLRQRFTQFLEGILGILQLESATAVARRGHDDETDVTAEHRFLMTGGSADLVAMCGDRSSRPVSCTGARPSLTAWTALSAISTPMTFKPREAMPASMLAPNLPSPITETFCIMTLSSNRPLLALNDQFRLLGEQLRIASLPVPVPLWRAIHTSGLRRNAGNSWISA